jgi:peptide chain release factor subunit 3
LFLCSSLTEFFEGQTAEHAMLARSLGVSKLIVIVNKMDEINWDEKRFQYIKDLFEPFLKGSCGFNLADVQWIPISGLTKSKIKIIFYV